MESKTLETRWTWVAVLAAYGLIGVIRVISWEFAFTYEHWIQGTDLTYLPRLTTYALPLIGISGGAVVAQWSSPVLWLILALWPGAALFYFFRESADSRLATLNLSLLAWLLVFSAITVLTGFGLWLPFSLL